MITFILKKIASPFKISVFIMGLMVLNSFGSFGQIEIARETFSNTTNITGSSAFGLTVNSTEDLNKAWNVTNDATVLGFFTGETGSIFAVMDDLLGNATGCNIVIKMIVPAGNSNQITFSGMFAAFGTQSDAGDNVVLAWSTDASPTYSTLATFNRASGTTYSDGTTTFDNFTNFQYNLGSGLATRTISIRCTFNGLAGGGDGFALDEFILYHTPVCSYPTSQVNSLTFANTTYTATDVSWSGGNGDKVLVVASLGGSVLTNPTDVNSYNANTSYGSGSLLGTGNYVVYNGPSGASTINLTGLAINTTYSLTAYSYNSTYNCYLVPGFTRTITTAACTPSTQATFTAFTDIGNYNATINWNRGSGNNVLIVAKKSADVTTAPSNGVNYTASSVFGSGSQIGTGNFVVYYGTGNTVTITGLDVLQSYSFYAYEHNTDAECGTYKTPAAVTGTTTSRATKYYVNDNSTTGDVFCTVVGSNAAFRGTEPNSPVASLQWLLSSSNYSATITTGDTIFIDAGTYSDVNLSSPAGGVVITGAGASKTIFDNPNTVNYFMYINDNNTVLSNLSITSYNYDNGGLGQSLGILANTTGVKILNVQNYYGSAANYAGGHPIEVGTGASVLFSGGGANCDSGGGTSAGGGIHITGAATTVTITNYMFIGNVGSFVNGIALRVDGGKVIVKNALFKGNDAQGSMQGVAMCVNGGTVSVYDSKITDNNIRNSSGGTEVGGNIYVTGGNFYMTRSIIQNMTESSTSAHLGSGIGNVGGTVQLDSCYFTNNGVATDATDVYNGSGTTLARYCSFNSATSQIGSAGGTFTISNCGNPTVGSSTGLTTVNTTVSSYTPNPSVPSYSGTCSSAISSFSILPIELTRFEGDCNNGSVILNWQTATEKNNKVFSIQRSANGVEFETIGSVNGAGNSSQVINYTFIDENKLDGISYYRLSQTDYDGKMSQSKIISVDRFCNEIPNSEITIYPNPTRDNFTLDIKLFQSSAVSAEIIDGIGRVVKTLDDHKYDIGLQSINLDVNSLATGVYYIKVLIGNQQYTHKLIKL